MLRLGSMDYSITESRSCPPLKQLYFMYFLQWKISSTSKSNAMALPLKSENKSFSTAPARSSALSLLPRSSLALSKDFFVSQAPASSSLILSVSLSDRRRFWYDTLEKPSVNYQKWAAGKNFSLGDFGPAWLHR
ncbi:hypothetical protein CIPAW_11G073700 [Carya illinoinensis]|uniref:Uncharacterized protein n=1 Tax=Carya illinoinensis TaxID=32201 RepID=A0A8T1P4V4_CARIL|nr:hypothetical protein CIPAW_11G073700 [Carya illinoinensis]